MLALGVILVLLATVAVVSALVGGSDESVGFDLGLVEGEISATGVFLTGAVTVLLLVAGLLLIRVGLRRAKRHRKNAKKLERLSDQGEPAERQQQAARPEPTDEPTRDPE